MKLVVIGVDHATLNMDERQTFYFRESDKLSFSTQLMGEISDETLILSTCNRSEVYCICEDSFDESKLKAAFLAYFHQKEANVKMYSGLEAIDHLLKVACGLESMVIGEDQILHQIKEALNFTMEQKFSGKELNYLFQNAIRFGKDMRTKYGMNDHPLSVSYIGYKNIEKLLNKDTKIMICGIGEMSQLMIEYLKDYHLYLVNRTKEKVIPFLNEKRTYIPFEDRHAYLNEVDIVVSATASPHTIFEAKDLDGTHPLLFLDLAMPRDVSLDVRNVNHTTLIDMDVLKARVEDSIQARQSIYAMIEKECEREKYELQNGLKQMLGDNLIQKMQNYYLDISEETFNLLKNKLSLNQKEEYILKKVLKSSFLRLMKTPVKLIKNQDEELQKQYIELVGKLFLDEEE